MSIDELLPKELQRRRAALFQELAKIAETAATLAADRDAFKALPADKLTPATRAAAAGFADRDLVLLQAESRAIDALAALHPAYTAALRDLHAAAVAELEQIQTDIFDGLLKFGYVNPTADPVNPCRITPAFWLNHPRYRHAAGVVAELRDAPRDFQLAARREQLLEILEKLKTKMAA